MKKTIATLLIVNGLFTLSYAAERYDTRAFRIVTKLCTPCHGTPFYMAKQLDSDDWEYFFDNEKKMMDIHKKKPKGMASLKNKLFQKHKKRLKKFFIKSSKDSGAVHGCDANFCGTHH
ncbi:hypothetical protein [Sulfurovum riftiae]|uniref:Cytochrome C n=1 Tax=Sulfurovum riftiae TaxID=1630136 RepID=A0A151CG76_9BACT|nr:hypothetical protein [Sulfurovum riftiae]KYJ86540.1 hypothetical protein AS592_06980 [Sulfurovum riftiae]